MGFFDWLGATAVSFTVAGNTGVAPFLSLFLVGVIEKANPDLLNMGGTIETLLSSLPSIILLVLLTILEFVSMCIPVVDEIVDSVMTIVLPIMSTLGSLSTFGLFTLANNSADDGAADEHNRELGGAASSAFIFFQIVVVLIGIILAFSIHALKMVLRLIGEGWLTNCLTILETTWIVTTITMAIFIRPMAIIIAAGMCCGALFSIKRNYWDKRRKQQQGQQQQDDDNNQASLAANAHEDDDYVRVEEARAVAVEKVGKK